MADGSQTFRSAEELEKKLEGVDCDTLCAKKDEDEKTIIKISKEEFDKLKKEYCKSKDKQEQTSIVDKFFNEKAQIQQTTKEKAQQVKNIQDFENKISENFSIETIKNNLEYISKIDEKKDGMSKEILLRFLLGVIRSKGYQCSIDNEGTIKFEGKTKGEKEDLKNELNTVFNNYLKANKISVDSIKTAILFSTSSIDNYISVNTDAEGKKLGENINSESYFNFLLEKYNIKKGTFGMISEDEIRNNSIIKQEDKQFLISYKKGGFDDFKIEDKITEYKQQKEIAKKIYSSSGPETPEQKALKKATKDRNVNEMMADFIKDPFNEIGKVIVQAGPIGGLAIIGAFIYFLFKEPKYVFSGIALWGLGKGTGLIDKLADEIKSHSDTATENGDNNKKVTNDNIAKVKEDIKNDPDLREMEPTKLNNIFDSLSNSIDFKNKPISELENAYSNKENQTLEMLFGSIGKIGEVSGKDFYDKDSANIKNVIKSLLKQKRTTDTKIGDLFEHVPEEKKEDKVENTPVTAPAVAGATAATELTGKEQASDESKEEIQQETPIENISDLKQQLKDSLKDFKEKAAEINKKLFFKNTEESMKKDREVLEEAYSKIEEIIKKLKLHPNINKKAEKEINDSIIYLAEFYNGKGNSHFKDYGRSIALCYRIVDGFEFEKKSRVLPKPPTEQDVLKQISSDKDFAKLKDQLQKHLKEGKTLSQILSNPTIGGAWSKVYEKCFDKYEKELSSNLKWMNSKLKKGDLILSEHQQKALNLLTDIQGAGGFTDFKSRNIDRLKLVGKVLIAGGASVLAYASIPLDGPVGLLTGSIAAGAVGTTLGMALIEGRRYSLKEGALEFGLNTATFAVGGVVFKAGKYITPMVNAERVATKVATQGGILAFEMGSTVVIGATNEYARAHFRDIGLEFSDALEQNLAWGLLPLGIRGLSGIGTMSVKFPKINFTPGRQKLAEEIVVKENQARQLALLGDKEGSLKVWNDIKQKINDCKKIESAELSIKNNELKILKNEYDEFLKLNNTKIVATEINVPVSSGIPKMNMGDRVAFKANDANYIEMQITKIEGNKAFVNYEKVANGPPTVAKGELILDAEGKFSNDLNKTNDMLKFKEGTTDLKIENYKVQRHTATTEQVSALGEKIKGLRDFDIEIAELNKYLEQITALGSVSEKIQIDTMKKILPGFMQDVKNLKTGGSFKIGDVEISKIKGGYTVTKGANIQTFKNVKEVTKEAMIKVDTVKLLEYKISKLGEKIKTQDFNGKTFKLGEKEYTVGVDKEGKFSYHDRVTGAKIDGDDLKLLQRDLEKNAVAIISEKIDGVFVNFIKNKTPLKPTDVEATKIATKFGLNKETVLKWTVGDFWTKVKETYKSPKEVKNWLNLINPGKMGVVFFAGSTIFQASQGNIDYADLIKTYVAWQTLHWLPAIVIGTYEPAYKLLSEYMQEEVKV